MWIQCSKGFTDISSGLVEEVWAQVDRLEINYPQEI